MHRILRRSTTEAKRSPVLSNRRRENNPPTPSPGGHEVDHPRISWRDEAGMIPPGRMNDRDADNTASPQRIGNRVSPIIFDPFLLPSRIYNNSRNMCT